MLNAVRIWILLSAWLVGAGWILSALHQLNRAGYAMVFALAGATVFFWCKKIIGHRGNFFCAPGENFTAAAGLRCRCCSWH